MPTGPANSVCAYQAKCPHSSTKTFEEIQPLTYDRIAMMVGYDSESTIEKKLKEIKAAVKEELIFIYNGG